MATTRSSNRTKKGRKPSPLMVRLDDDSKAYLAKAAELRGISLSDYVRMVTVAQAKREVLAAREQIISLTAEEQLAFWNALNEAPRQVLRKLGRQESEIDLSGGQRVEAGYLAGLVEENFGDREVFLLILKGL